MFRATRLLPFSLRRSHAVLMAAGVCLAPQVLAQALTVEASYTATDVNYRIPYANRTKWIRVYIDADRNATTGYSVGGVGAGYMIENGTLYRYSGSGGTSWGWAYVKQVGYTKSGGIASVTATRADLGSPAGLDLVANTDPPAKTSAKITQTFAATTPTATSDATNVYYKIPYSGTPTWVRVFLDTDANATTGYRFGTIGASYLIENGNLYRYSGTGGTDWAWTPVKRVSYTLGSGVADIAVSRADLGSPSAINLITNTEPPSQTSAVINQVLGTSTSTTTSPTTSTSTTTSPTTSTSTTTSPTTSTSTTTSPTTSPTTSTSTTTSPTPSTTTAPTC